MENTKSYVPCQEDFVIIGCDDAAAEQMPPVSLTYWQHSFRRFKSNKVALVSAVVLLLIVVMTIVGPLMSPYDMEVVDLSQRNLWPSATYWFGTDQLGRDLFSRVWEGGRVSIIIGLLGSLIVALVGCIYRCFRLFWRSCGQPDDACGRDPEQRSAPSGCYHDVDCTGQQQRRYLAVCNVYHRMVSGSTSGSLPDAANQPLGICHGCQSHGR